MVKPVIPSNSGELEPAASAEPVCTVWHDDDGDQYVEFCGPEKLEPGTPLYTAPVAAQQPSGQDREDAAAWLDKLISLVVTYGDCRHFEVEATDKRDAADRSAQAFANIMAHARAAKEE